MSALSDGMGFAQTNTRRQHIVFKHIRSLESEAVHIMREVLSESENPVMLYSVGKDSAVMLHSAKKAFISPLRS